MDQVPTGRVTVRTDAVLQRDGVQAWGEPFSYPTFSEETPYDRAVKVGEDWQLLDLGWLRAGETVSLLILRNLEGDFKVNPTPQEQTECDARIVEVSLRNFDCFALVRPQRQAIIEPSRELLVRCRSGVARVQITAVPN